MSLSAYYTNHIKHMIYVTDMIFTTLEINHSGDDFIR